MRVAGVFANIEIEREHGTRFDGLFLFFFFFSLECFVSSLKCG